MPKKTKKPPKPPASTAQQAADIVAKILGPQLSSVNTAYRNQGQGLQAAYGAAAELSKGVAPAITQTYDAASAREAVIAKGLQLGAQLAGSETAGQSNTLLGQQGSQQQVQPADIGSVLGTLGGLGASGLNREGAAFSAAAEFLPTKSTNLGLDSLKQAEQGRLQAVKEINAQRPKLIQDTLGGLQSAAQSDRDQRFKEREQRFKEGLAAAEFDFKLEGENFDRAATTERLKQGRASLGIRQSQQRFNQLLSKAKLELDEGQFKLAIAKENRLRRSPRKGGFSAVQKRDLQQLAFETAREGKLGVPAEGVLEPDATKAEDWASIPDKPPVEILRDLIAAGVPFSIAMKSIVRFYPRTRAWVGKRNTSTIPDRKR